MSAVPSMVWCLPIPSAPGYFATIDGHIVGKRGKIMQPWQSSRGYFQVLIRSPKKKNQRVNRLVCEAFHGPAPSPEYHAAHNDGCKSNNAPSNLRWATSKENIGDRLHHGTWPDGERNSQAKLTSEKVREIIEYYRSRMTNAGVVKRGTRIELAHKFGVSVGTIRNIIAGNNWRHISVDLPFLPPPPNGGSAC